MVKVKITMNSGQVFEVNTPKSFDAFCKELFERDGALIGLSNKTVVNMFNVSTIEDITTPEIGGQWN